MQGENLKKKPKSINRHQHPFNNKRIYCIYKVSKQKEQWLYLKYDNNQLHLSENMTKRYKMDLNINIYRKIHSGSTIRLICILERKKRKYNGQNYQIPSTNNNIYKGDIQFIMVWFSKY